MSEWTHSTITPAVSTFSLASASALLSMSTPTVSRAPMSAAPIARRPVPVPSRISSWRFEGCFLSAILEADQAALQKLFPSPRAHYDHDLVPRHDGFRKSLGIV